jgi:hypothetical protein
MWGPGGGWQGNDAESFSIVFVSLLIQRNSFNSQIFDVFLRQDPLF